MPSSNLIWTGGGLASAAAGLLLLLGHLLDLGAIRNTARCSEEPWCSPRT